MHEQTTVFQMGTTDQSNEYAPLIVALGWESGVVAPPQTGVLDPLAGVRVGTQEQR